MAYVAGLGTLLALGSVTIAQRVKLEGPDSKVGETDVTHLDSTYKEFRPTLPEAGTVSGTLLYDPANASHVAVRALIAAPASTAWTLTYSDSTTDAFQGFLTGWKNTGMEVEGYLQAEFTIRIDGIITTTP